MSRRITKLSQLKPGQRIVSLSPVELGIVSVKWFRRYKDNGEDRADEVEEPAVKTPQHYKVYYSNRLPKGSWPAELNEGWLKAGILVGSGPCKPCDGLGLVRNKATGEHKQCKLCYGGWLGVG